MQNDTRPGISTQASYLGEHADALGGVQAVFYQLSD